jgi:hypothetical protein
MQGHTLMDEQLNWPDEHLNHLRNVFGRLREANLTVRPSTCDLAFEEVHCLGHIVGNGIVKPDPVLLLLQNQMRQFVK